MNKLEEVKNYYEVEAVSQSFLKDFVAGFPNRKRQSKFMDKGNILDARLTMKDHYDDLFVVSDFKPDYTSGTYKVLAAMLEQVNYYKEEDPLVYALLAGMNWDADAAQKIFDQECKRVGFYYNASKDKFSRGLEARLKAFDSFSNYWQLMINLGDKTIISSEEDSQGLVAMNHVMSYHLTAHLFRGNENVHFQYPIHQTVNKRNKVDCKGLIDIIEFDHQNKTGIIYDVKNTSYSHRNLYKESKKWLFQGSFYKYLAELAFKGYKFSLKWIVYSEMDQEVQLYNCTDKDVYLGQYGYRTSTNILYSDTKHPENTEEVMYYHYGCLTALDLYLDNIDNQKYWIKNGETRLPAFSGNIGK